MKRRRWPSLSFALALALLAGLVQPSGALAASSPQGDVAQPWPAAMNNYLLATGAIIADNNTDQNPSYLDLASGTCAVPATGCIGTQPTVLYYASDQGTVSTADDTVYFRFRLATDITDNTKGGIVNGTFIVQLATHDAGTNTDTLRAVVGVDGKGAAIDYVYTASAPGTNVVNVYATPWDNTGGQTSGGMRIVSAGDGSGNYFLDFQVPLARITTASGGTITAATPIKMYYGSSAAANLATINKDLMLGTGATVDFSGLSIVSLSPASLSLTSGAVSATGPNPPNETQTSTYTVTVTATNPGGAQLTSATASIPLPAGVTASFITPSQGSVTGSGTLNWTIGTLLPGESETVTFTATVTPALGTAGTTQTLVNLQSASGSDVPAAATRTATAPAITVGVIGAAPSWTLSFNSQGGAPTPSSQTVANSGTATAPADPTYAGHTFTGWYTAASGGSLWNFPTDSVTANTIVYAHWTLNSQTVTFDSQGGAPTPSSQTVTYGGFATTPTAPTRTGYTLDGWYTAASGGSLWTFASSAVTADITLHAHWTPVNYTVTFDSHDGTAVDPQGVAYGAYATAPTPPTQSGYTFAGWYTAASGGSLWDFATTAITGDTTLHARWTPINYTVTFDSQGGSSVGDQTVPYGGLVSAPAAPTQTGATFAGWFTAAAPGGTAWAFGSDTISGDKTLYAHWTPVDYTLSFDSQGGSSVGSQTVAYGAFGTEPSAPTRTGYTLDGWYTAASGGVVWTFAADAITENRTLYAQWTPIGYTVTFDAHGGTPVSPETVAFGDLVPPPAAPTFAGYTFNGWFTAASGGTLWAFGSATITGDRTLHAQWTPIDYTVTFDTHGGSLVGSQGVTNGATATEPSAPTRTGYSFDGWFDAATGGAVWNFAATPITGDVTIHAQWTIDTHPVTFSTQGGALVASQTVVHDDFAADPGPTTRAGYTFDGWYDSASGGTAWDFSGDAITGPTTIYAHWTISSYPVTFESQGGSSVDPQSVTYGGLAAEPTDPTLAGHTFDGWFDAASGGSLWNFASSAVSGATTLYAQWTPIDYTVTYQTQGGSPVASASVAYNSYATAPATPTRSGYTFNGWFDAGSGGSAWGFASTAITADVTIYAQWTAVDYVVEFDSRGGTPESSQTVAYDALVTEPASDPTRAGHTFAGWYDDPTAGALWAFATATVAGSTTLYAHWDPIDYTITFDGQNGDALVPLSVAYGAVVPEPSPDPTLAGYAFAGWFTSPAGGSAWDFASDVVVADATLYAHWTPLDYTVTFDGQGGAPTPPDATVANGSLVPSPAPPTLTGSTFSGWYTAASGGSLWDFGATPVTGNTTLYAQWVLNTHTVTFDSQGGSFVVGETLTYGNPVGEPTAPTRYGYVFDGWFDAASGGAAWNFATSVTADTILYAYWTPAPFIVTYDSQGGVDPAPAFVDYGTLAMAPTAPTITGYTFLGWYTTPGGALEWDFAADAVTADVTLYGQWAPTPYDVVFHSEGGSAIATQSVDYGSTALDPGAPTLGGNLFQGWFTAPSGGGVLWDFAVDPVLGDTDLYAYWTGNDYPVTFDSQGGTAVAGQVVTFGDTATEPSPDPTRAGYTFAGWWDAASGGAEWDFVSDTIAGDTTIYAQWTPIPYTVTFDSQGGTTTPSAQTIGYGGTVTEPAPVVRPGYVFTAWHTTWNNGFEWNFATDTIAGDRTLYAQWTPEHYAVSFDPQGGVPTPTSQSVANGDFALAPSEPALAGYTFDGWYTADVGGTLWDFATDPVTVDTTLYGHWTIVTNPVTFDSQGGGSVSGQTIDYGDFATAPAPPTQPGYTFDGWFDSATGGTLWDFGADAITAPTTLYAYWTPVVWTLTFDSQSGSPVPDQPVTHATTATAPTAPTLAGYTFDGWYTAPIGGSLWDFGTGTVTGNTTLYAHWTAITHPVTFESDGGSPVMGQTVNEGDLASEPAPPTRPGYTFDGWFDSATGGTLWDFGADAITAPTTLYAYWTPVDWTLSFDSQSGSPVPDQTVTHATTALPPTDPTYPGRTFTGWYTAAIGGTLWDFTTDTVSANTTLYAQWTLDSYPVTFNAHGGTAVSGQTVDYGDLAMAPAAPTQTGYTFDGWFTAASGGSLWNFAVDTITGATTLHAHWTPIDYAVTFESEGGSAVSGQTVPFGGTAIAPADPTRTGHTFDGWFTAASGGSAWVFSSDTISGPTTLHAQWTPIDYTVQFDSQGGTTFGSETVAYSDHAADPGSPTRVGYNFAGWYDSAIGGSVWDFAGNAITGPTTIFAQWTIETHVVSFNATGGSTVASQTVDHGNPAAVPTSPTRTGYTFGGWYTAASGGSAWDFAGTAITGVTTIFAHWTLDTFPVSFDSQGGSSVAGQTVGYGAYAVEPGEPTRAGYLFDGWFDSMVGGAAWDFAANDITGATTIYGHWIAAAVVSFDSTGGTSVPGQTLPLGGTVTPVAPPSRPGFTFVGWYTAPTGGALWDLTLGTVGEDLTLYAHWESVTLAVTGADSALQLWWAALLTSLGLGFLLVARRRDRREDAASSR